MDLDVFDRSPARFTVVVGKGGVGKSTTAAALALRSADEGVLTHLVSTDPAHSIGDLFEQPLVTGARTTSECHAGLSLEELDAPGRARLWFAEVRESVADLVDRGTYLDRENVSALLDRSLPGMDEIMAALRIAELARSRELERIVVDTAPTGHTLRLLDSGTLLEGWVRAMEAMAEKAGAVALGLTRRRSRLAGEIVLDTLSEDVALFADTLRDDADIIVVTRRGEVVSAETERLVRALRERRLQVRALVRVEASEDVMAGGGEAATTSDGAESPPVVEIPHRSDLIGCRGLRRWGRAMESTETEGPRATAHADVRRPAALPAIPDRPFYLLAGKGGVGKTTCAAAFALARASDRRVLLTSLDPAGSLEDVLARPIGSDAQPVGSNLSARQVDAERLFAEFRQRYQERIASVFERLGLDRSATLDRRVLESLLEMAPPGLDEIFALDAILEQTDHDLLVVDTAPTGHFLRLLEMPHTALSWTRALMRILLQYRSVLGLDDVAPDLLQLAKRLGALIELLEDASRTGVFVVTLAEALPRLETQRLVRALEDGRIPLAGVIHNRWRISPHRAERLAMADHATSLVIRAPWTSPPPIGPDRLAAFAASWTL